MPCSRNGKNTVCIHFCWLLTIFSISLGGTPFEYDCLNLLNRSGPVAILLYVICHDPPGRIVPCHVALPSGARVLDKVSNYLFIP